MANICRKYFIESEDELRTIAANLIESDHSKLICLRGDLGMGKTAFVKALCNELKCKDQVSSPTFSLINEYLYAHGKIYHIDLYRLDIIEEALDIGIEDYLTGKNYCFIEWPELVERLLYGNYIDVFIKNGKGNARNLLISYQGFS